VSWSVVEGLAWSVWAQFTRNHAQEGAEHVFPIVSSLLGLISVLEHAHKHVA